MLHESFSWKSLSIIGGLTLRRFYFQIHPGSIKSAQVIGFIKHLRRHIRGRMLIIWDGAAIHKSAVVKDYVSTTRGKVMIEHLRRVQHVQRQLVHRLAPFLRADQGCLRVFQPAFRCGGLKISILTSSKARMKLILALLLPVLALADPASSLAGKTATLRDGKGKASTTYSTSGTKTTFRDAQGRTTGTATQSSTGKTTFRDAQGRMTGTSNTSGSKTTCRDAQGRLTGTSSNSSSGLTTYRDSSGRITGTSTIRGNTITFRDASGRLTGTATVKQ